MNEDNNSMTVSMAQQALTGVNGGASANAPNFEADAAKSSGQSLFREAFGENDPNKMPSGGGGATGGGGGLVNQFVNPVAQIEATATRLAPQTQMQQRQNRNAENPALVSGASQNQAFAELGRRDSILRSALVESLSRVGGFGGVGGANGGAGSGLAPSGTRSNQQIPQQPVRLTMARSAFGGGKVPHYDYNGVMVALPDGVDANDANAVGAAMAEQNALIDMMNEMNDEED